MTPPTDIHPSPRTTTRVLTALALATTALATTAACSGGNDTAAPSTVVETSRVVAPETTTSPTPTDQDTTGADDATADRCATDELDVVLTPLPDRGSQKVVAVTWTNGVREPCTMFGFGGVDLRGPEDPTYGPVYSLPRSSVEPQTVTIASGESAQTTIIYLPDPEGAWTPTEAAVTPPDDVTSVVLPWTFGPVLRQDGATRPGTYLEPVSPAS